MPHSTKMKLLPVVILLLFGSRFAVGQDSPKMTLQSGIYAEEVLGDLEAAISYYETIIARFPHQRDITARALLRAGLCYEKMEHTKAETLFSRILQEYPDQVEVVRIASGRLGELRENKRLDSRKKIQSGIAKGRPGGEVDPLVRYYFERLGVDIMSSTSHDGQYLTYTDWMTGSLMYKEIEKPERTTRIVEGDFSSSYEFAYKPVWSRDGRNIAYSWFRAPYWSELRVVSTADKKSKVIFSRKGLTIYPQDWSPDDKTILFKTVDFDRDPDSHLLLISIDSKEIRDLTALMPHARGLKFSPDGRFITYDALQHERRRIQIMSVEDLSQTTINLSLPAFDYDAPVWSKDGNLILCRTSDRNDLVGIPVENGRLVGRAYIVQSDLVNALLAIKGIRAEDRRARLRPSENIAFNHRAFAFIEDFSSPTLDPAWSVFSWDKANVYEYKTFGRYSLTQNPGHLRFFVEPGSFSGLDNNYQPKEPGWYWDYPGLEISRSLYGDRWQLETVVTYWIIDGANTRNFDLAIVLGTENLQEALLIRRNADIIPHQRSLSIMSYRHGIVFDRSENLLSPNDTLGVVSFTYHFKITRTDSVLRVTISDDGLSYTQTYSHQIDPKFRDLPQRMAITGGSWFVPAGSYADWDFFRFTQLD